MLTFELILFFSGLCVLSYHDAKTQSVPAWLIDPWCALCVLLGLTQSSLLQIGASCGILGALSCFAWVTRGLGSADVLVIAALGCLFGTSTLLLVLLLAAISGLIWALFKRQHRLAWLPHLLLGSIIVLLTTLSLPAWHLLIN